MFAMAILIYFDAFRVISRPKAMLEDTVCGMPLAAGSPFTVRISSPSKTPATCGCAPLVSKLLELKQASQRAS